MKKIIFNSFFILCLLCCTNPDPGVHIPNCAEVYFGNQQIVRNSLIENSEACIGQIVEALRTECLWLAERNFDIGMAQARWTYEDCVNGMV